MGWIVTASGRRFDLDDPRPEMVDVGDIAEALAKACRFAGHCRGFYSVARHSILVSAALPAEHRLCGLLHDAPEAYLCDLPSPVKRAVPRYRDLEHVIWRAVASKFGLPSALPEAVKDMDRRLLATERRDVVAPHGYEWGILEGAEPLAKRIVPEMGPYDWRCWRTEFLKRFWELAA